MKKVLIVEDDPTIARIYQGLLRMEGTEAEVARDGESALEMVHAFRPDLVVLDLMLPKVSGLEVLKSIRSLPETRALPVIVFSNAYLNAGDRQTCQSEATHCLVKSETSPKQLLGVIRNALSMHTSGSLQVEKGSAPTVPKPSSLAAGTAPSLADYEIEDTFQAGVRRTLLSQAQQTLWVLRTSLQSLRRTKAEPEQRLEELSRTTHVLSSAAGIAGCGRIAQVASALEALVTDLRHKPSGLNESCHRTIAQTVDFLETLFAQAGEGQTDGAGASSILVVDDEPISRRAICMALARASLRPIHLDDPHVALKVLQSNTFDLLFLDVDMPGMTGFELCQVLRSEGINKSTPVVFVTGLADFNNRALSIRSGGNDVIAKPFSALELMMKALLYIWKSPVKSAAPVVQAPPAVWSESRHAPAACAKAY